jgi:hypothetical protein
MNNIESEAVQIAQALNSVRSNPHGVFDEVYNDLQKRFPDGIPADEYIPTIVSIDRAYKDGNCIAVGAIADFTGESWQTIQNDLWDNVNYDGHLY